jgi:hypothetical protein
MIDIVTRNSQKLESSHLDAFTVYLGFNPNNILNRYGDKN